MAVEPRRQSRTRYPLPPNTVDLRGAAELLLVSEATIRRRLYSGQLRAVGRRSDCGVLLDRAEVEQMAAAIRAGKVPRDHRHLTGQQGRTPSTPVAERQTQPAVQTADRYVTREGR